MWKRMLVAGVLLGGTVASAQQQCSAVIPQCEACGCTCVPAPVVFECAGGSQPHFVLDDGTGLSEAKGQTASFSVADLAVQALTLGNVQLPPFTIGTSESRVRYTTSATGECVEVKGLVGFHPPDAVVANGRALTLQRRAFFCREPNRDLFCVQAKGQVGAPFPPLPCPATRLIAVCGLV